MKLTIMNSPTLIQDGTYVLKTRTTVEALALVAAAEARDGIDYCTIGDAHRLAAELLTTLFRITTPIAEQQGTQKVAQQALVFTLAEPVTEGRTLTAPQIETIGYTFQRELPDYAIPGRAQAAPERPNGEGDDEPA